MRYASIRDLDISNGEGVGVALFVQGCSRHCYNCFNQETWDFNGGKEWTKEVEDGFLKLIDRPYIKRISILGGEPLAYENLPDVYDIVKSIRTQFPDKIIWLYTGYTLSCGINEQGDLVGDLSNADTGWDNGLLSNHILRMCNVVVDGEYIDDLRDFNLKWKGSSNQRVIDIQQSIKEKKIVLYCD